MSTTEATDPDLKALHKPDASQEQSDTIRVSPFDLPTSRFLSVETQEALRCYAIEADERVKSMAQSGFSLALEKAPLAELPEIRQRYADIFYTSKTYENLIKRYPVSMQADTIAGVYTEVFTPKIGVAKENHERVLINLHGGAFMHSARTASHQESIPIAALGNIKVISVDYRMAPEHQFPAASDDVVAVYKALLQHYKPENIGLYGCSAGGILSSQAIARFQKEGLPLPSAVGMFCAAAHYWSEGDSGHFAQALVDFPIPSLQESLYFKGVAKDDPMAFPGNAPEILANFPPSLLIVSTRDYAMSSVVYTHSQLTRLGIDARLQVWEGLDHAFILNAELPESREAYKVIVDFFQQHLGKC